MDKNPILNANLQKIIANYRKFFLLIQDCIFTPLNFWTRHKGFLLDVLKYSLTAFGGPQGHLGMMMKTFVDKRKDITEKELMDYIGFCQMLPGPSSTQTVSLIGYKRGGLSLGILTICLWIIPAAFIMGALSFLVLYLDTKYLRNNVFHYITPMAVGFIIYAAYKSMKISVKSVPAYMIMFTGALLTILIRSPWVFPLLIVAGGFVTNFTNKEYPPHDTKAYKVNFNHLLWFILVFLIAGVFSEWSRVGHWKNGIVFNLFENFYRCGSLVYGGGNALVPYMLDQFVHHKSLLTQSELLTGFGLVQAIPGPVFSLCSYTGGLCIRDMGWSYQILGCLIGTVGVFLPGALLMFFFFPLYQNLKQYRIIYRALEGVQSVIVGILWGSSVVVLSTTPFEWIFPVVILSTLLTLLFTQIPPPYIVLFWLFVGITI